MIQAVKTGSPNIRKRLRADSGEPLTRSSAASIPPSLPNTGRTQKRNLQRLKIVKEHIEELILLSDRRLCQELIGGVSAAENARYKAESQRLVARVRQLVGVARSEASARDLDRLPRRPLSQQSQETQVRVHMSTALVRILEAFSNAGKRPGRLIERALWNDRDVQNAALLLRIKMPPTFANQTSAAVTARDQA